MSKPISPEEVAIAKIAVIPDFVFDAVNHCIVKAAKGGRITVLQKDIIDEILRRAPTGTDRAAIFDEHWLDFEPAYRGAGWSVSHDKPGYCETYEPHFIFERKR